MVQVSTALLSAYDKIGIKELGRFLHGNGVRILATEGTGSEIGREYVTLVGGPQYKGGVISFVAGWDEKFRIPYVADTRYKTDIELVVVNLLPLHVAVEAPFGSLEERYGITSSRELLRLSDPGGHYILRHIFHMPARKDLVVVTDPRHYPRVTGEISSSGRISPETVEEMNSESMKYTEMIEKLYRDRGIIVI